MRNKMITNDRIFHILAVAKLMKEKCLNDKCDDEYIEEMFNLGCLHDIATRRGSDSLAYKKSKLIIDDLI